MHKVQWFLFSFSEYLYISIKFYYNNNCDLLHVCDVSMDKHIE